MDFFKIININFESIYDHYVINLRIKSSTKKRKRKSTNLTKRIGTQKFARCRRTV